MTLGELILTLKEYDAKDLLYLDFCKAVPRTLVCWRGRYKDAALTFDFGRPFTVEKFLDNLNTSIFAWHSGPKGGLFKFDLMTPLHVDNDGVVSHTEIVMVRNHANMGVVIETAYRPVT